MERKFNVFRQIYLIQNGQKRHYPSLSIYQSYGYPLHSYAPLNCDTINSIPDGPPMPMKSTPTPTPINPLPTPTNSSSGSPWWYWLLIIGGIILLLILIGVGIYFTIRHKSKK